MLHESPELVHRFYQDVSKLGRPEPNGIMGITTTMIVSSLSLSLFIYTTIDPSIFPSHTLYSLSCLYLVFIIFRLLFDVLVSSACM